MHGASLMTESRREGDILRQPNKVNVKNVPTLVLRLSDGREGGLLPPSPRGDFERDQELLKLVWDCFKGHRGAYEQRRTETSFA
ncbi:hypothetical protein SCP_1800710 [Sparassis crispa]|uniref:Uncharacterized protein n=1 Tax=Sparassis crispa TaxID=139825 RepID=A0A401H6N7_9APHY|nr:hypothetical protein SCP_1800710 [Sparassis crispa]GBE90049.1 hypothetical protein SCP_1800710 [Sparassis crispa]